MKTPSEMREDAQKARNPYFATDLEIENDAQMAATHAAFAADSQGTAARIADALTKITNAVLAPPQPYTVTKGTIVLVANKSLVLKQHILKENHFFINHQVGNAPILISNPSDGEGSVNADPVQLLTAGYFTFETCNPDWPYMVVPCNSITIQEIQ